MKLFVMHFIGGDDAVPPESRRGRGVGCVEEKQVSVRKLVEKYTI